MARVSGASSNLERASETIARIVICAHIFLKSVLRDSDIVPVHCPWGRRERFVDRVLNRLPPDPTQPASNFPVGTPDVRHLAGQRLSTCANMVGCCALAGAVSVAPSRFRSIAMFSAAPPSEIFGAGECASLLSFEGSPTESEMTPAV